MTAREFGSTVAFLLGLMAVLAAVEHMIPLFARGARSKGRASANLGLTALTFLLNWGLSAAAAVGALVMSMRGVAVLSWRGVPEWAIITLTVITLDLCTYLAHVLMHKVPVLWRFHSVHHSDEFLDVTTSFRQHPIEGVWRFLWIIVPVWLLGLPAGGVVVYRVLSAGNAILEHANIRVWPRLDQLLSWFWSTPNWHKVHHSCTPEQTDSNYGNILAVFDRGFRTFTPTGEVLHIIYGLERSNPKRDKSLAGLMTVPFARSGE